MCTHKANVRSNPACVVTHGGWAFPFWFAALLSDFIDSIWKHNAHECKEAHQSKHTKNQAVNKSVSQSHAFFSHYLTLKRTPHTHIHFLNARNSVFIQKQDWLPLTNLYLRPCDTKPYKLDMKAIRSLLIGPKSGLQILDIIRTSYPAPGSTQLAFFFWLVVKQ